MELCNDWDGLSMHVVVGAINATISATYFVASTYIKYSSTDILV